MKDNQFPYSAKPTLEIVQLLVHESDQLALSELIERRKPFSHGGKNLRIVDFLLLLCKGAPHGQEATMTRDEVTEDTYDLTLAKFTNLPSEDVGPEIGEQKKTSKKLKRKQVDCRNYYRVVLNQMEQWRTENPGTRELEEEQAACTLLQRLVVRHFYLSRLEVLRRMRPYATRYAWKVGTKSIKLWYPTEMPVKVFREWLQQQPQDADQRHSELQSRVQSEIDSHFFRDRFVSIDDLPEQPDATPSIDIHDPLAATAVPSMLAQVVAREKINQLDELRPAIRELGKKTVEQLVLRVFSDMTDGIFEDGAIAKDFGLSKATFSRFAGSQWQDKPEDQESAAIPDLWKNTAKVISAQPLFLEAAQEAGVSSAIARVLNSDARKKSNE